MSLPKVSTYGRPSLDIERRLERWRRGLLQEPEVEELLYDFQEAIEDIQTAASYALSCGGETPVTEHIRAAGLRLCLDFGVELNQESEMA